ncbi:MAG TPA: VWA domain-containing protein [Rhodanobacteraceae bacterium]
MLPGLPLHFLRPWWWLALLPLPFALWALLRSGQGRAALARIADAVLLPHLVHGSGGRGRIGVALVAAGWVLAVAALSGPAWRKAPAPLYVNGAARVVALSLSDDMLARDLQPDRMTRARFAVRDLLDDAGDAQTALVAFAGAAFTVAPLTDDKRTVLNLLRALRPDVMPVPGNDAAAGIRQSVKLLQQAHVKGGQIVLVTDTADDVAVAAARTARADGIRVDVLGVGTPQGAPVPQSGGGFVSGTHGMLLARRDDAALRAVATAGGGRYVILQPDGTGPAAFGAPVARGGHASHGQRAELWRDGGVWLLPLLVILGAFAFRRGWLLVLVVLVLPLGMPAAHASTTWDTLWSNRNQRALQALQRGDAQQAARLATTPGMRGAADYRAGDFADAARAFAKGDSAQAQYNLGNALARQGKYPRAIDAYRAALRRDPKLADARANLEAIRDWLRHHQKPNASQHSGGQGQQQQSGAQPGSSAGAKGAQKNTTSGAGSAGQPHGSAPASGAPAPTGNGKSGANQPQPGSKHEAAPSSAGGPSPSEAAQEKRQVQKAAKGLGHELQQASRHGAPLPRNDNGAHAFALGQNLPGRDDPFDAEQRALLRSVPDDPGALLRRKFRLEWQQRNGQQQGGGQP